MGPDIPDYDYSTQFNYDVWSARSQITMLNVRWTNDYRDIVRFQSQSAFDQWINRQTDKREITQMSPLVFERNVRIDVPLNAAMRYNYVRASNPISPVEGDVKRNYYYFILDVRRINASVTELVLQLDVWQTFGYEVTFGNCWVDRGHIGIANTKAFDHFGRDYLTVAEGQDIGGEYRIVHTETESFGRINDAQGTDADSLNVLMAATTDFTADPGSQSNPNLSAARGGSFNGMPTGASFYAFKTVQDFYAFMDAYSTRPWMTQGIISLTVIPLKRYFPSFVWNTNVSPLSGVKFYQGPPSAMVEHLAQTAPAWRGKDFIRNILGAKYDGLLKFLTYPYMIIELTTFTGSPLIIKPESWQNADGEVKEVAAFVPPGQRIAIMPKGYNADGETGSGSNEAERFAHDDSGEFLDFAATLDDFPALPIVNNMAINFMASNKNGLAFQFRSADWSQQRAMMGAQATADVAGAELGSIGRQAGIGNTADTARAAISARAQSTNQGISNLTGMMNPLSGAAGLAGADLQGILGTSAAQQTLDQNMVGVQQRGAGAISDIQRTGAIRDTNVGLARSVAKGDYANERAGINAKIQDAQMLQPSTAGQFGGQAFNMVNNIFGYSLRWKMPNLNALRKLGDYWLRYGYAVGQYMAFPSSFMCMTKFTYWQIKEAYISQAPIPETFKQTIRGIFEKGVTVWAQPEYIGTTALEDNEPIGGMSY